MQGDAGDGSNSGFYRNLAERSCSLEESHKKLVEQFDVLLQEKDSSSAVTDSGEMDLSCVPGAYFSGSPYRNVLDNMGHAVYVSRAGSGEIIFWNQSAERLYGYKEHEALGRRSTELLVCEEYHKVAKIVRERLSSGQSWSGQFPCKKRSGQIFMAMVTKSPLYEDGELSGVITVAIDAAPFNHLNSGNTRTDEDNDQADALGINFKRIQWHPQPQIASSVSNLASKVFSLNRGEDASANVRNKEEADLDTTEGRPVKPPRAPATRLNFGLLGGKNRANPESCEKDESTFDISQPSKIAAKVMSKLQISGFGRLGKEKGQQNGYDNNSVGQDAAEPCPPESSESTAKYCDFVDHRLQNAPGRVCAPTTGYDVEAGPRGTFSRNSNECPEAFKIPGQVPESCLNDKELKPKLRTSEPSGVEDSSRQQQSPKSGGSTDSLSESDSNLIVDCEILWEHITLKDEIGQGSYGVLYHGVWNGSDVAVKVYCGNRCSQETLLEYKKEIEIMKRLRHPNVLLFMGAIYSQEKPAIVTEFLPRGSLFKTLHQNNQPLDFRRRLRMALDVARGMNYLHRRNPPIIHRDLKSSSLLVDKSWTVKVGDFGLSRLKDATLLTTKSGLGTHQWMAPEVLRDEPSTEKSDVFSFGVILWELMTESIPWSNLNSSQVVAVVGFMDSRLDIPENLDTRVSAIILDCWQSNPALRPSFQVIIQRLIDIILSFTGSTARKNTGTISTRI